MVSRFRWFCHISCCCWSACQRLAWPQTTVKTNENGVEVAAITQITNGTDETDDARWTRAGACPRSWFVVYAAGLAPYRRRRASRRSQTRVGHRRSSFFWRECVCPCIHIWCECVFLKSYSRREAIRGISGSEAMERRGQSRPGTDSSVSLVPLVFHGDVAHGRSVALVLLHHLLLERLPAACMAADHAESQRN